MFWSTQSSFLHDRIVLCRFLCAVVASHPTINQQRSLYGTFSTEKCHLNDGFAPSQFRVAGLINNHDTHFGVLHFKRCC